MACILCILTTKEGNTIQKYSIIYADPPWQYDRKTGSGVAENHYSTMPLPDICALPVRDISAPDSALFLWATFPQLREALQVIEAWGFTYKTVAFVWVKPNRKSPGWYWGMGFYTRSNAEICLLATRGKPRAVSHSVHQIIDTPAREHSRKPDEARQKIVDLMGDLPRAELFARQRAEGWDIWGNELENSVVFPAGKEVSV